MTQRTETTMARRRARKFDTAFAPRKFDDKYEQMADFAQSEVTRWAEEAERRANYADKTVSWKRGTQGDILRELARDMKAGW